MLIQIIRTGNFYLYILKGLQYTRLNPVNDKKLIIFKNILIELFFTAIFNYVEVFFNKNFGGATKKLNTNKANTKKVNNDNILYIRKVINLLQHSVRFLRQLHPIKKKLKVKYYEQNTLVTFF